mgnify:CR=1 FL=1
MTSIVQNNIESSNVQTAAGQMPRATRLRGKDNGPTVLPHLEHFVLLTRKVQRPSLIRVLLENAHGRPLPTIHALTDDTEGSLPTPSRNAIFAAVAELGKEAQARIERAAERIVLLVDEYGAMAVAELLDTDNPKDAEILTAPTDKFSRALYLYLRQEFPQKDDREDRFDHAERRQQLLRQFQSEKYSSHYLGPKGAQPGLDVAAKENLKQRLAELFPQVKTEDILIEPFAHRESDAPDAQVLLYTLSAKFNGKHIHYPKIINGEDTDVDDSSTVYVRYSWHASKGELSVFSDDETVRPELAKAFRDVVLGGNGDIHTMPMREFDLMGFCTPAILARFKKDRIDGIESIDIKHLLIANPEVRQATLKNRLIARRVENPLLIKRDRFEDRNIYEVAGKVYPLVDLTNYVIKQVKLTFRIAKTVHRKAHDVSVQITTPNGFNDGKLTKADSELVFAQLMKLDCARQY